MNSCRLIYRSCSTEEIPANEELLALSQRAADNNQRDGITGLLVLSGATFLQVLEGENSTVNALFQKISQDSRHHTIEILQFEPITEHLFEDWSMRLVDLQNLPGTQRQIFMKKYDHDEDGSVFLPDKLELIVALLLDVRAICLKMP